MQLSADSKAAVTRFIRRIIEHQEVWALQGPAGVVPCDSHDDATEVLPFWSDAAYARRAQREFPETEPFSISLFDFLFRWLPGMEGDGVLVGPNWSGALEGIELEPAELHDRISDALPTETREALLARLHAERRDQL